MKEDKDILPDNLEDRQLIEDIRTVFRKEAEHVDVEVQLRRSLRKHQRRLWHRRAVVAFAVAAGFAGAAWLVPYLYGDDPMNDSAPVVLVVKKGGSAVFRKGEDDSARLVSVNRQYYVTPTQYGGGKEASVKVKKVLLRLPAGHSAEVVLPDGSRVWQHAGSTLTFPTAFYDGKRVVELDGEAYFKVVAAKEPFIVKTPCAQTQVYGTEFNIKTRGMHSTEVTLVSGCVGVSDNTHDIRILPGQQVIATESDWSRRQVDTLPYTSWRDGFYYYDDIALRDVLRQLGEDYALGVEIADPALAEKKVHFTVERGCEVQRIVHVFHTIGIRVSVHDGKFVAQ